MGILYWLASLIWRASPSDTSSEPTLTKAFDAELFPHILDAIVDNASYKTLLAFRAVSQHCKARADAVLAEYLVLTEDGVLVSRRLAATAEPPPLLYSTLHSTTRLPALYTGDTDPSAWETGLASTHTLDIHGLADASHVAAALAAVRGRTVHTLRTAAKPHGSYSPTDVAALAAQQIARAHTYICATHVTAWQSTLAPPGACSRFVLSLSWSFANFRLWAPSLPLSSALAADEVVVVFTPATEAPFNAMEIGAAARDLAARGERAWGVLHDLMTGIAGFLLRGVGVTVAGLPDIMVLLGVRYTTREAGLEALCGALKEWMLVQEAGKWINGEEGKSPAEVTEAMMRFAFVGLEEYAELRGEEEAEMVMQVVVPG